jgi:hypothetical protein
MFNFLNSPYVKSETRIVDKHLSEAADRRW